MTNKQPPMKSEFQALADRWENERPHGANVHRMVNHPAYRQIIRMGQPAVPWLLERLSQKPDHWFVALAEITGANPVPEASQGKIKEMAQAWIDWGKANGHLQ